MESVHFVQKIKALEKSYQRSLITQTLEGIHRNLGAGEAFFEL